MHVQKCQQRKHMCEAIPHSKKRKGTCKLIHDHNENLFCDGPTHEQSMIAKPSTSFGRRYDQVARIAPGTRQKNESIRKRSEWPETHSRTSAFVKFIYSHCLAEDIEVGGVTKPCFDQTWPSINGV